MTKISITKTGNQPADRQDSKVRFAEKNPKKVHIFSD